MSNGYRAQWKIDSTREAEVHHFTKLKAAESFLNRVVKEAHKWLDEKDAAIAAGVDPLVANFGSRATGLDASGKPLPETPAKPRKPAKPRRYVARVYAPQMVALGARAATILLDLAPLILAHWKRLVEAGIDPRRLALENNESKMAALLFDEIGVQYHDFDAGDYNRLALALDRIEAWLRTKGGAASVAPSEVGVAPVPSPVEGPAPAGLSPEENAGDAGANGSSHTSSEPANDCAKPASAGDASEARVQESASEPKVEREAAPYSGSGTSLDWTKS